MTNAVGLVPIVPEMKLAPDLILLIFLPPLLYSAAFFSSPRDLKANLRPIASLSIGLVLLTTVTVAVVGRLAVGLPWGAAFVLGAIVSPTDPVAATAVVGRLRAPRQIVTILEGESLINDGTALVLYSVAVSAVATGSFSLAHAGLEFVLYGVGGTAIGLAVGWAISRVRRRIDDPLVEITVTLFTPLRRLHPGRRARRLRRSRHGRRGALPRLAQPGDHRPPQPPAIVRVVGGAALLAELGAFHPHRIAAPQDPKEHLRRVFDGAGDPVRRARDPGGGRNPAAVDVPGDLPAPPSEPIRTRTQPLSPVATGRHNRLHRHEGAISLAAALAIPITVRGGASFPGREQILFLTFCVILFTLVVQGLSLPVLVRRLGLTGSEGEEEREEIEARLRAAEAALARLEELSDEGWVREETAARMRDLYEYRRQRFAARDGGQPESGEDGDGYEERSLAYQRFRRELLGAERSALLRLRGEGRISDEVRRRVERDLEEARLEI
jgi:monovalent cation/hydrogen antiporter